MSQGLFANHLLLLNRSTTQVETIMPIRTSLTIKAITFGMIIFFSTTSFALANGTSTLLQFLDTEYTPVFPLLPRSLSIAGSFKPSTTSFAGTVAQLQGTAYVYHKNGTEAYSLKIDLPIFSGDTLITGKDSQVTFNMSDDSTLILTAQSKLVIEKSLPMKKVRDTALHLFFGRVRSLVKKMTGKYIIKTPTGNIGVRGTDFAVAVAPAPKNRLSGWKKKAPTGLLTAVLTGGNQSTVELAGLFGPSIIVKPFSAAGVRSGSRAEQVVYVGPAAVPLLQKIAPISQTGFSPGRSTLPNLPKKSAPVVAPCWPFPGTGTGKGLKYFRVCDQIEKPDIKLRPETK